MYEGLTNYQLYGIFAANYQLFVIISTIQLKKKQKILYKTSFKKTILSL